MSKQNETKAKTHPRFNYRIAKEHKQSIEEKVKELTERINRFSKYKRIPQNDLFLEALNKGLEVLDKKALSDQAEYTFIKFEERKPPK